ncbi:RNase P subunit p30 domain containing protein, partial [Amanita muscaria]
MFFDLNVPVPSPHTTPAIRPSKKFKGKAPQQAAQPSQQGTSQLYTQTELKAIETRIDLLVHLGYTVLALTQTVHKKVDPKTHTNTLDALVSLLRPRPGILYLKRLSIILDDDSEKGFGLINAHTSLFSSYDLLSLTPTTHGTFSLACLTHTLPSPLTTHIISLPLTLPRFNFYLKHTLIRTALKNGAAFELPYVGSLGGSQDDTLVNAGYAESGPSAKRNWWAAAREVVRVTKGKGIIVTSGSIGEADLRAPRDVANLLTLLGIPQDTAIHSLTNIPKSITIRARKTYRAVLSGPTAVIPEG